MNCPHGLADPMRCDECVQRWPDPIAQGKACRLAHKLATCTHSLAERARDGHCDVCGATRPRVLSKGGRPFKHRFGPWLPTTMIEAAKVLDAMFKRAGVAWGPPTDDSDEEIVTPAKSRT